MTMARLALIVAVLALMACHTSAKDGIRTWPSYDDPKPWNWLLHPDHADDVAPGEAGESDTMPPCATDRLNCRNFELASNNLLNRQIELLLSSSYAYKSMANFFKRSDMALRGFSNFFGNMSLTNMDHAKSLMDYITLRGGFVQFINIPSTVKNFWDNGKDGVYDALIIERDVTESLLNLHWHAINKNDMNLADFLQRFLLDEMTYTLYQLSTYNNLLNKMKDNPMGEFMFDEQLYMGYRP